jgi:hypothetical protein
VIACSAWQESQAPCCFCSRPVGTNAVPLAAQKAITVKSYREWKNILTNHKNDPSFQGKEEALTLYVKGIGDGFVWANSLLDATNHQQLFCVPGTLGLNADNYQQILEDYLPTLQTRLRWPTKRGNQ